MTDIPRVLHGPARCRSCDASIIWCRTTRGRSMPVDAEASADGNVLVDADGVAHVLSPIEVYGARARGEKLRLSHFVRCPAADEHRRSPDRSRLS